MRAVGLDLTCVSEVRKAVENFGSRYLNRVFTPGELSDCKRFVDPAPQLAARFSAKEAAFKALSIDGGRPPWTSVEVVALGPRRWELVFTGKAAELARVRQFGEVSVSLTCADGLAGAIVVASGKPPPPCG